MADVWPFVPLPDNITETLSWSTEVQATPEVEVRRSLRAARRSFTYSFGEIERFRRMSGMVAGNLTAEWDVPIWTESSKAGPVLSTDTELNVDMSATYTDRALVFGDCDNWVVVEIEDIGATLTLTAPVGQGFDDPSVMPLKRGFAPAGLSFSRKGYEFFDPQITFDLDESAHVAATTLPQYLGLDYSECAGVYYSNVSGSVSIPFAKIDNAMGPVDLERQSDLTLSRMSVVFVMDTPAKRLAFSQWLHLLRGRDRPFWMPSPGGDLELIDPLIGGQTSALIVPRFTTAAQYVGRHLNLGNGQFREVTAAVAEGDDLRLYFGALGADAYKPTLMSKVRLDTDQAQLSHSRGFVMQTTLPVIEVVT